MSTVGRFFRPLVQARTWKETLALLVTLPLGIAWFTIVVTMVSLSAGLLITLIGIPLLLVTIGFGRVIGAVERARARALLDAELAGFPKVARDGSWWTQAKRVLGDGPGWRGLSFGVLDLGLGIVWFTLTVTFWSVALSTAAFPIYNWFLPHADGGPFNWGEDYELHGWGRVGVTAAITVIGLILLGVVPRIIHGLAKLDRAIVRGMLSPSATQRLEQRVEQLTVSRDASVEGSSTELRRIERDLHDGAQQRLVSLAMNLGMAKERIASGQDPAAASELVDRAHDEAKLAIVELRDLVRGIHPQVLTDRGLDAALSALAARSSVPVTVDVSLPVRPSPAVEATAYFVVAEAMANLSKHSRATRGSVRVEQIGRWLMIDVRDDGHGGAVAHPGGGLDGLRDRVAAVEGTLRLTSPVGGPTEIHVELPCAS